MKTLASQSNVEWLEPAADWLPIARAVFRFGFSDTSVADEPRPAGAGLFSGEAMEQANGGFTDTLFACQQKPPPSLKELNKLLLDTAGARTLEINEKKGRFLFGFDEPCDGVSARTSIPGIQLVRAELRWPDECMITTEGLISEETPQKSAEEIRRREAHRVAAVNKATVLAWREYILPSFNRLVAKGELRIYARIGNAADPLRRLLSDLWPRLKVLDWQHGIARDPEGTNYYSVHAASNIPTESAKQKAIAADEKTAIKALARQLEFNRDLTVAQALTFCRSSQFRVSARGFERIWRQARTEAGLSPKAPPGRKKKSPR